MRGARQVGKTYLLKNFGETEYADTAYFNFEADPKLDSLFQDRLDPSLLLERLSIYREKPILAGRTLVIFDEIQESDKALNSLKYFSESAGDHHVAAAGSLLGIKLAKDGGFPVGKVNFHTLHPLSFLEFLEAVGKSHLKDYLTGLTRIDPLPEAFHDELMDWLKKYFVIGGMPEAVKSYAEGNNLEDARRIQGEILASYQLDFSKHISSNDILKIAAVWTSLPAQLAKENKKFIFSAVKRSARAREYETALQWLEDAGLILKCRLVSSPKHPLAAYAENDFFKVYLLDVGLLGAMSRLPPKVILDGDRLFQEFSGALTENFVAQALVAEDHPGLFYWTSEGIAEVDFLLSREEEILPLEVKAGLSKGKKSLQAYQQKYRPRLIVRASPRNLKKDGEFCNLPLYLMPLALSILSRAKS